MRTGRHACFDRVVVDVLGPITSWNANYPLSGNSETTLVIVFGAQPTAVPFTYTAYPTPGYRTVRDLAVSVQPSVPWNVLYIGTRSRLPYRVFTLAGAQPGQTRLVVDVAHRW